MASTNRRLRLMSRLRQFGDGMDVMKYLKGEHKQNLKAIEDALRDMGDGGLSDQVSSLARNYGVSGSASLDHRGNVSWADVTGTDVTLVSNGRPVALDIIGGDLDINSYLHIPAATNTRVRVNRTNPDGSTTEMNPNLFYNAGGLIYTKPPSFVDDGTSLVSGSSYTYIIQIWNNQIYNVRLFAHEV